MDDFFKNNSGNKEFENGFNIVNFEEDTVNSDIPKEDTKTEDTVKDFDFGSENVSEPIYNPIEYSEIKPIENYKPMSRGLKLFSLIMIGVIILTSVSIVGYFAGRSSVSNGYAKKVELNLAARPKKTDEMTEAQVYDKVNESIVGIVVYNSSGIGGQASGIVYSKDGYIVTNDHIYAEVPSAKFKIYTHDGTEYDATYVAGDKISDLAVLKIKDANLTAATFGNSDEVFCGEHVVAIGRPNDATDDSSITGGIVSAVNRRVQTTSSYSSRLIQTDSAINPGSSGGALVNMYGQVIGVTSSKLASVEYESVGFAIPTTVMKRVVEELIEHKKVVSRAKLGVTYTMLDSVSAEVKGYEFAGLLIDTVAEESGLYGQAEKGDVITHINGTRITSDKIVLDIIERSCAGDTVSITVVTSTRKRKTFDIVLKANVGESSYSEKVVIGSNEDALGGSSQNPSQTPDIFEKDPDIFGVNPDTSSQESGTESKESSSSNSTESGTEY